MTTFERERGSITTAWEGLSPLQTDLWYLITQLWILNTNDGDRIVFHTGNYSDYIVSWDKDRKLDLIETENNFPITLENWEFLEGEWFAYDNVVSPSIWQRRA